MLTSYLIAVLTAVDACATMLRGGIWDAQGPCVLESEVDASQFGGVVSVVGLSR